MDVQIVTFPETKVVAVEHLGPPALEYDTVRKLVAWKLENRLLDQLKYRSYGIHYTNPLITPPSDHRVDFCLSFDEDVGPNPYGIRNMVIPSLRCAFARDIGSRSNNKAAIYLHKTWLPQSGESPSDFPIFFHYVNVGPNVREEEMMTDVYLPLK
ncbi:GyrI-like domain-containing protein [Iodobacter sp. CM08]|uniref:AraC family transcriptional regulator n=1 Tax=Iodobacter sp. CM08 TaxID=3085902 RepID=UPI002981C8E4|nr:GyrI-like domain-containing protein [Iodobacter sp. CM08]MDW5419252.1 GyrI-like domain-containing protein [Iodobacter sp. CM08]